MYPERLSLLFGTGSDLLIRFLHIKPACQLPSQKKTLMMAKGQGCGGGLEQCQWSGGVNRESLPAFKFPVDCVEPASAISTQSAKVACVLLMRLFWAVLLVSSFQVPYQ